MHYETRQVPAVVILGAHLLCLFIAGVAFPQTSFFQGKTVTIIQSSAAGNSVLG